MNSSDAEEEEESDASDYDEFKDLNNLGKNGLSIAEVLEKAKSQAGGNLKVIGRNGVTKSWFLLATFTCFTCNCFTKHLRNELCV